MTGPGAPAPPPPSTAAPEGREGRPAAARAEEKNTRSRQAPAGPEGMTPVMGKIDDACKDVVTKVEGAVACGVVDLDTGMLLGIYNTSHFTQALNEIVALATMDLFRGPNVGRIEQMVRQHRNVGEDGAHYFQEVQLTSERNLHFAKTLRGGRAVVMLVTRKTTNAGMGWAMLKSVIPAIEPLVP